MKQLERTPIGYRVLHCHISALPGHLRTRDNMTQALAALRDATRNNLTSSIFLMKNMELICVCRDIDMGALRSTASKAHKAFGHAGLQRSNVYGDQEFYHLFELGENDARLRQYAEAAAGPKGELTDAASDGKTIDGSMLSRIKAQLQTTNISPMILSQQIYAVDKDRKVIPVFREIYVSIKALEDAFCPGVSLMGRSGLFNELTEDLDAAVLGMLARTPDLSNRRFSLNLNLSAISSKTFAAFDAALRPEQRANVVIEIHRNDLVANFSLFRKLAPGLVEKGYSLCIDALDASFLPHLDLKGLNFRFAKMFWHEDALTESEKLKTELTSRTEDGEGVSYILARCDNANAIRVARSVGIDLLQGKLVDHMVKNNIPI
ncbi:hypothetical protein CU669_04705 [Paramagnetospirillum kuznetsovii]|uniref:EAL domain-containing protein n=1 Tax=Paramagnetospirillum kuznetsovii TaxID=2053833 RepID=A0A364P263_9PROT|nr:hypothetical protein CU669_04705 [Paramagnetospirillum kuznetsovii]